MNDNFTIGNSFVEFGNMYRSCNCDGINEMEPAITSENLNEVCPRAIAKARGSLGINCDGTGAVGEGRDAVTKSIVISDDGRSSLFRNMESLKDFNFVRNFRRLLFSIDFFYRRKGSELTPSGKGAKPAALAISSSQAVTCFNSCCGLVGVQEARTSISEDSS